MMKLIWGSVLSLALCSSSTASYGSDVSTLIKDETAIQVALAHLDVEVIGVRFDEPDTQWDVFIRSGDQAYEIEVDALSGKVVAAEPESLEEVRAELSGNLSHEGVSGDKDK